MLPKVANQLIHHTSRAVAAVQNQTGHTIRNVLQLQSSGPSTVGNRNGPGSSSSGRGSGAGAGGARQSTSSSRFYNSYTSFGRSVTQADPSSSVTLNPEAFDDVDDVPHTPSTAAAARIRRRTRNGSLSFATHEREARAVKLGVVQALQQHLRAQHAFAAPPRTESAPTDETSSARPLAEAPEVVDDVTPPEHDQLYAALLEAHKSKDIDKIRNQVAKLRSLERTPIVAVYNAALQALHDARPVGEALHDILELYNDMVNRSVVPNSRTYGILITALTDRDKEVTNQLVYLLHRREQWASLPEYPSGPLGRLDERIAFLRSESNFTSALTLFQASSLVPRMRLPKGVYGALLTCCAEHGNLDAALQVFSQMEKRKDFVPNAMAYRSLIAVYGKVRDIQGAKEVFEEYKRKAKAGHLHYPSNDERLPRGTRHSRYIHIVVYNEMLTAYMLCGQHTEALGLLEQMMDSSVDFTPADIPTPSNGTFSRIVDGFIRSGDIQTAYSWFQRLLSQEDLPKEEENAPILSPTQPSQHMWLSLIKALASHGMIEELNHIVDVALQRQIHTLSRFDAIEVVLANVSHLESLPEADRERAISDLDRVYARFVPIFLDWATTSSEIDDLTGIYIVMAKAYVKLGEPDRALKIIEDFIAHVKPTIPPPVEGQADKNKWMKSFAVAHVMASYGKISPAWSLKHALRLLVLGDADAPPLASMVYHMELYARASQAEKDSLDGQERLHLLATWCTIHFTPPVEGLPHIDFFAFINDVLREDTKLTTELTQRLAAYIHHTIDPQVAWERMQELNPQARLLLQGIIETPPNTVRLPPSEPPAFSVQASPSAPIHFDPQQTRLVDEFTFKRSGVTVLDAYECFIAGAKEGRYPSMEVLSRLINALGRQGELQKVFELYNVAQGILAALEDKPAQLRSWIYIEDAMIIALAHAGDTEAAHVHRARILEHGGCPSSDAYGALIQQIKDTTDDTVSALALFQEALNNGVTPNIFLYNTVISKLAKARKADQALELFTDMRTRHVRPTSVTYGAVIAACCRVGDAASAENLFEEMVMQTNFRPRVPPYNTMMQLYTQTKPDRERVLHYYNALLAAGVQPTAHTYKLLIDAYGSIEPVDINAMEDVFDKLVKDRNVQVQGTHWAALINAYGCVRKDLDKAIQIFDSIRTHPSSQKSPLHLPDAVVFEALMNVFVTLRRTDLIAEYTARLPSYGIRMTAYIANLLIKGYASSGNIEQARAIFESLVDPPEGVAAPFNHAPHEDQIMNQSNVQPDGPVFREPSTWEAMVRAELGNGNRDEAVALLERVKARRFPPAVYHRISGIMLDDSVSPWASKPSSAESSSLPSSP